MNSRCFQPRLVGVYARSRALGHNGGAGGARQTVVVHVLGMAALIDGIGIAPGLAVQLDLETGHDRDGGRRAAGLRNRLAYSGQSNLKRVTTECGGKTPQIVLGDTPDLDTAVEYAVNGIYSNQGEVCNAGPRLLVEHGILDDFTERFRAKARTAFVPGDPLDPATTMGPLVTAEQQSRVLRYLEIGKQDGATLEFGGGVPQGLEEGCYVEPTLFTGVDNSMRIAREEIFGPVAGILPVRNADDAIAIANDSIYGLAAPIWGGFKQSGFGRDRGLESLLHHTQTKSMWLHIGDENA